jgi:hypothetical protein
MQENAEESKVDCKAPAIYINFLGIITKTKFETRIKLFKTSSFFVRNDTDVIIEVVRTGKNDLPWMNHWNYIAVRISLLRLFLGRFVFQ